MTWSVVILSKCARNLSACIRSVLANEPALDSRRIFVVDDGARALASPVLPPLMWLHGVKPFVYARNANIGVRAAATDIILLNDDAELVTPGGFTSLVEQARLRPELGVC